MQHPKRIFAPPQLDALRLGGVPTCAHGAWAAVASLAVRGLRGMAGVSAGLRRRLGDDDDDVPGGRSLSPGRACKAAKWSESSNKSWSTREP